MAETSSWVVKHGIITAIVYLIQFFVCNEELLSTDGNAFETIFQFITYTGCGLEAWQSFIVFMLTGLPWLIMLVAFLFKLAQTTTGLVILLVTGVAITLTSIIFT